MIRSQIMKFTKILCHENLELYSTLSMHYWKTWKEAPFITVSCNWRIVSREGMYITLLHLRICAMTSRLKPRSHRFTLKRKKPGIEANRSCNLPSGIFGHKFCYDWSVRLKNWSSVWWSVLDVDWIFFGAKNVCWRRPQAGLFLESNLRDRGVSSESKLS